MVQKRQRELGDLEVVVGMAGPFHIEVIGPREAGLNAAPDLLTGDGAFVNAVDRDFDCIGYPISRACNLAVFNFLRRVMGASFAQRNRCQCGDW